MGLLLLLLLLLAINSPRQPQPSQHPTNERPLARLNLPKQSNKNCLFFFFWRCSLDHQDPPFSTLWPANIQPVPARPVPSPARSTRFVPSHPPSGRDPPSRLHTPAAPPPPVLPVTQTPTRQGTPRAPFLLRIHSNIRLINHQSHVSLHTPPFPPPQIRTRSISLVTHPPFGRFTTTSSLFSRSSRRHHSFNFFLLDSATLLHSVTFTGVAPQQPTAHSPIPSTSPSKNTPWRQPSWTTQPQPLHIEGLGKFDLFPY